MGLPYSYLNRILLTFLLFCTTTTVVYAQQTPSRTADTTQPRSTRLQLLRDSTKATIDTTIKTATALAKTGKDALVQSFKSKKSFFSRLSKPTLPAFDSAQFDIYHPYKRLFHTKPLLRLNGGYVSYQLQDFITLHYERGYLPGFNKSLIRNEMGSIQYVKSF